MTNCNLIFVPQIQEEVRLCFEQLAKVLRTREKQLLRQIEAIHNQQLSIVHSNPEVPYCVPPIQINLSQRQDLEDCISKFGELSSSNGNGIEVKDAEPYKIEDYVEADRDHVTLDKCIKMEDCHERIKENLKKLNDSNDSFCEMSFNTSSEADITSENEITVLINHNYSGSSDGLKNERFSPELSVPAKTKDLSHVGKIENEKLLNDCSTWELKVIAQTNTNFIVPETVENNDSPVREDSTTPSEKNRDSSTDSGSPLETSDSNVDVSTMAKPQDGEKHPKQIQQWLEQILVETETEPIIHEIEQFAEISKSRFKEFSFPLET